MNLGLQGKLAVVSGSTAGIGLAIATALAAEGAKVVVNGRTQARVESFLHQVSAADVLVNNLGIFDVKAFQEISDAEWLRFFEVNVLSGVRLARAYLPGMLKKNWGRVIFISSESAQHIPAEMIHYGMTKTAQVAIARGIAESVAGTGVTVNSILAGP